MEKGDITYKVNIYSFAYMLKHLQKSTEERIQLLHSTMFLVLTANYFTSTSRKDFNRHLGLFISISNKINKITSVLYFRIYLLISGFTLQLNRLWFLFESLNRCYLLVYYDTLLYPGVGCLIILVYFTFHTNLVSCGDFWHSSRIFIFT